MGVLDDNTKTIEDIDSDSSSSLSDAVASVTQSIHSQSSSPSLSDEVGGKLREEYTQYLEDTLPLDDVHLFGDGVDTQILDLDGQTQVLDPSGETQVLDEWNTAVQVNGEDEECGDTQFLGDTQVLSDGGSVKRGCEGVHDVRSTPSNSLKKDVSRDAETLFNVMNNKEQCSGSMVRGFTSVRAASLRASGLAARDKSLNKLNTISISKKSNNFLPGHITVEDTCQLENGVNQQNSREDFSQMKQFRFKKVGSSTARKLFTEDKVSHMKQADDGNKHDNNGFCSISFKNGLGGLNYVNSEEPGELSQANALEVVDEFLEHNAVGDDSDVALKKSTGRKGKLSSTSRGVKSLAKKATTRSAIALSGAYYWDDNLEDEGGGEFFQKNKNLFFSKGDQMHSTKKGKTPSCSSSKSRVNSQKKIEKEKLDTKKKMSADALSDSKMMPYNLGANRGSLSKKKTRSGKNQIKNMDEQMKEDGEMENGTDKNVSNIVDVGYDNENRDEGRTRVTTRKDEADKGSNMMPSIIGKGTCFDNCVLTRQSKKARTCVENRTESCLTSAEQAKNVKKQSEKQIAEKQPKKAKAGSKDHGRQNQRTASKITEQIGEDKVRVTRKSCKADEKCVTSSTDPKSLVKCAPQEQHVLPTPVANRTRGSSRLSYITRGKAKSKSRENTDVAGSSIIKGTKAGTQSGKGESCKTELPRNLNSVLPVQSTTEIPSYPTRRRTRSQLSSISHEASDHENRMLKRLKTDDNMNHSSACGAKSTSTRVSKVEKNSSGSRAHLVSVMPKHSKTKGGADSQNLSNWYVDICLEASPKVSGTPSVSGSENAASLVCMGDEYHKQSWRKNPERPSLKKERNSLIATIPALTSPVKGTRKRSDLVSVRIMFSRHLSSDIIKKQKKILTRLGASEASSMSEASHFVADVFTGTRNMLEAIASGKPVVTHQWLESCAEASCFIDESSYILRDARKEKELGFNMPFSLARAGQFPILKGQRVLITPNTKPGKEILTSLVKAVHGLVVERLGRSSLKDEKLANDLLILSCEEDYDTCLPFLEKGVSVYSSELLINGIVTQRLEYERYRLFTDAVKRTRSTLWLKKNDQFVPIGKGK